MNPVEKLGIEIFKLIRIIWKETIKDENHIFHKRSDIEQEVRKNLKGQNGKLMIKILRAMKYSILKKGTFYYTQRELAEYFKTSQTAIQYSLERIQKTYNLEFFPIKTKWLGKKYPKKRRMILLPVNKSNRGQVLSRPFDTNSQDLQNILREKSNSWFLSKREKSDFDHLTLMLDHLTLMLDHLTLMLDHLTLTPFLKSILFPEESNSCKEAKNPPNVYLMYKDKNPSEKPNDFFLNKNHLRKNHNHRGAMMDKWNGDLFVGTEKVEGTKVKKLILRKKVKRLQLKSKPNIVTYNDYSLHPKKFSERNPAHIELNKAFDFVLAENIFPDFDLTEEIINYWNAIDNQKFSKTKPTLESKTAREICLYLMYAINKFDLDVDKIKNAINIFDNLTKTHGMLKYIKKYSLLNHFLTGKTKGKDWFDICIKEKEVALSEAFGAKTEFNKTKDLIIKNYTRVLHNGSKKRAESDISANFRAIIAFTETVARDHRDKLIIKDYLPLADYISDYFDFLENNYLNKTTRTPTIGFLFSDKVKQHFFRHMRNQGYPDFGYPK